MRRGAVARGTGWLWLVPIVLAAALVITVILRRRHPA